MKFSLRSRHITGWPRVMYYENKIRELLDMSPVKETDIPEYKLPEMLEKVLAILKKNKENDNNI